MNKALRGLVGIVACLTSGLAPAADHQGNYAIWGAGGRSCHQFAQARPDAAKLATFRDYLMGYLTAVNTLAPDTYDALGGESLETSLSWLADYCGEHKMDSFERAVGQLLVARHDQRLQSPPSQGADGVMHRRRLQRLKFEHRATLKACDPHCGTVRHFRTD
ncbi:MAG: hypothetical protein IPM80_20945 [Proteobacteria bacterium]|nr:hypothetical protein [Pseudomonadota bacterium]